MAFLFHLPSLFWTWFIIRPLSVSWTRRVHTSKALSPAP